MNYFETKNHLIEQIDTSAHKSLFIMAAENSAGDAEYLINFANYHDINVSGGIFPKVIFNGASRNKGLIAGMYETAVQSYLIDPEADIDENIKLCSEIRQKHTQAYFLIDGMSPHIARVIQLFNQNIGKQVTFVGGGAGYSTLTQKPCIFNNSGIWQNRALIVPMDQPFVLSMEIGWEPLGPTLISNKTAGNYFLEFNWRNAFEYYSYIVEKTTGEKIDAANFAQTASHHPLGIYIGDGQFSIRDVMGVNDRGHIATTINVNEHTMLSLMHGNPEKLMAATHRLMEQNIDLLMPNHQLIIFNCLSRENCLGPMLQQELELIYQKASGRSGYPVVGVMSLGEIMSGHHGNIIFQNKSIVSNITQNA